MGALLGLVLALVVLAILAAILYAISPYALLGAAVVVAAAFVFAVARRRTPLKS